MKEYHHFNLTIRPEDCGALSQDLSKQKKAAPKEHHSQITGIVDATNHIQQAEIFRDQETRELVIEQAKQNQKNLYPENIYGKAEIFSSNKEEVAKKYQEQSDLDALRFGNVELNIDGKTHKEENLPVAVAAEYDIEVKEVTMAHITSYLKGKYQVSISSAQKNFLNIQWNQASIQAAGSTFPLTGFPQSDECAVGNNPNKKNYNVFNFNENGELDNVQYVHNVVNIHTMETQEEQTGTFTTTADISNLQGPLPMDNPRIPQHSPRSVSIDYTSNNGLACHITPEVHEAVTKYAKFKGRETKDREDYLSQDSNFVKSFYVTANEPIRPSTLPQSKNPPRTH